MSKLILSAVATATLALTLGVSEAKASPQYTVVTSPYGGYYYAPMYRYTYSPAYAYYPNYSYYYSPYYYSAYPYRTYWYGGYHPWHRSWGWRTRYWR